MFLARITPVSAGAFRGHRTVVWRWGRCHRQRMSLPLTDIILRVVERAPSWVRRDLSAKDASARVRAEEALAAMIADALSQQEKAED